MSELKDSIWSNLQDASGSAAEVPILLEIIANDKSNKDAWFNLWSRLCHQGDTYSASYVSISHISKIALTDDIKDFNFFLLPASIEVSRNEKNLDLPEEIKTEYWDSIKVLGNESLKYINSKDIKLAVSARVMNYVSQGRYAEANLFLRDEETERIKSMTQDLKNQKDELMIGIGRCLAEKGININNTILVEYFSEDAAQYYMVVVTSKKEVFEFYYDWLSVDKISEGRIIEWHDFTDEPFKAYMNDGVLLSLLKMDEILA